MRSSSILPKGLSVSHPPFRHPMSLGPPLPPSRLPPFPPSPSPLLTPVPLPTLPTFPTHWHIPHPHSQLVQRQGAQKTEIESRLLTLTYTTHRISQPAYKALEEGGAGRVRVRARTSVVGLRHLEVCLSRKQAVSFPPPKKAKSRILLRAIVEVRTHCRYGWGRWVYNGCWRVVVGRRVVAGGCGARLSRSLIPHTHERKQSQPCPPGKRRRAITDMYCHSRAIVHTLFYRPPERQQKKKKKTTVNPTDLSVLQS